MVEAVSSFETSGNFYQATQCNIPEDSHLQLKVSMCTALSVKLIIFVTVDFYLLCREHI
jgi:hypothetical protein